MKHGAWGLVVLAVLGFSIQQDQNPQTHQRAKFAHPFYGFKITLPLGWMPGRGDEKIYTSFYAPAGKGERARVDFVILQAKQGLSALVKAYKEAFAKEYPDFKLVREEELPSKAIQFQASFHKQKSDKEATLCLYSFCTKGSDHFVLSFAASESQFKQYEKEANALIGSFEFYTQEPKVSNDKQKEFMKHYNEAMEFTRQHQFDKAIEAYRSAEQIFADWDELHVRMGVLYTMLKQYESASKELVRAVELDPADYEYRYTLGTALLQLASEKKEKRFYEDAVRHLKKATELEPEHEEVWTNMGVALTMQDKYAEAKEAFLKAIQIDPKSVSAHYNLGVVYETLEDMTKAKQEYEETLKLNPKHAGAKEGLEHMKKDASKKR